MKAKRPRLTEMEVTGILGKLIAGDALHNRAALSPEAHGIYHRMIAAPFSNVEKIDDEGMRESGQLCYQLASALSQESRNPAPTTLEEAVELLSKQTEGFDTPEATERAARADLDEIFRILKGSTNGA
jgi:hypothetical protein